MGRDPSNGSPDGAKSVGAYYTPTPVARALCTWAVRGPGDTVLDPAAGDGVFLAEAAARLRRLGCDAPTVTGVELRPPAAAEAEARLAASHPDAGTWLRVGDFLALEPGCLGPVDAVVGNPPYIRFQRLGAAHRRRAAAIASASGVGADPLASSWAAFVLHAERFLAPGGRLALVLPNEIGHARYARGVLSMLRRRFAQVTFVVFESALFPSLDQGTLLLLAEGHGTACERFSVARLASAAALGGPLGDLPTRPVDATALSRGAAHLHHAWLSEDAHALLADLRERGACTPLASWASVNIGYVTGANAFFHLSPDRARSLGLDRRHLRPALFRSRSLRGLVVTPDDWRQAADQGYSGYLLAPDDPDDAALAAYLGAGEESGVRRRAKVRRRSPWYRVGRATPPDLALTPMSAVTPRLAVNGAGAAVSNTLYAVRLSGRGADAGARLVALAAITSLAELSAELVGHALGGGMLKLEPSEALRMELPLPRTPPSRDARAAGAPRDAPVALAPAALNTAFRAADLALRRGDRTAAREVADHLLLRGTAGLTASQVTMLRDGAACLRALRRGLRTAPAAGTPADPAPGRRGAARTR